MIGKAETIEKAGTIERAEAVEKAEVIGKAEGVGEVAALACIRARIVAGIMHVDRDVVGFVEEQAMGVVETQRKL